MTSPFDGKREEHHGRRGFFEGMAVGESRTFVPKADNAGPPVTLTRTRRPFIFDWVDAVNETIPESRGVEWIVDRHGNQKLVNTSRVSEQDRQRMLAGATRLITATTDSLKP